MTQARQLKVSPERASGLPAEVSSGHGAGPGPELRAELTRLSAAARERRSVDAFARAALGGFCWAVLAGVCGKLLWDSARPPLFLYPLALLDLLLLWDAARSFLYARRELSRELRLEARVDELRALLGVDLPGGVSR